MLVITKRAKQKLQKLAEEAPIGNVSPIALGIRIVLTRLNSGVEGQRCRIGIDKERRSDMIMFIGENKLLIGPATLKHLRHMNAILEIAQGCPEEGFVLIVDGPNHNQSTGIRLSQNNK